MIYFRWIFLAICFAVVAAVAQTTDAVKNELFSIFDDEWQFRLQENPDLAVSMGKAEYAGKLPAVSAADELRRAEFDRGLLQRLAAVDREKLSETDRVNYDVFKFILENRVAEVEHESYLTPISSEGGFYTSFLFMIGDLPFENAKDYQNYLSMLAAFTDYTNQHIELMREGLRKGKTLPKMLMSPDFFTAIDAQIVAKPGESPLFDPFEKMPETIAADQRKQLVELGKAAIAKHIIPSFKKIKQFLETEYIPGAKAEPGVSAEPGGKDFYAYRVRFFTTTNMTPDEVFEIGQKEVARIRAEMEKIIADLKFEGSFAEFLNFLRTDPQFYAKTPRELMMEASYFAKKADGKLPEFFGVLPRNSYGVEPVPADIAPKYTGGRYVGGSLENGRAGLYWVNTFKLESRPLYVLPALTLHESVPGHHLQISLAQEMENVPNFRKSNYLSAYGEGWALYTEYLGEEMGIYETPYQLFGKLTYEMWRACRLVVDVGIHAKGWSRDAAVEFMASNTALSLHEVNTEIDRYIGWPAQALSYKIGELKIRELRKTAEAALGEQFDLRKFHDVILSQGAVPLFVLEDMVKRYIALEKMTGE